MRLVVASLAALVASACAHKPLAGADLDRVRQVAFLARIAEDAGPKSTVFRDDSSYRPKLAPRRIDDAEADRRLALVLAQGNKPDAKRNIKATRTMSRFEVADTLRAETLGRLPDEAPWRGVIDPVLVARSLESFLVQEVPANAPDYERLRQHEVDTIVEIVVEDFGMRSEDGKAGVYLRGFARMFRLDGGELYHRFFFSDDLKAGLEPLDPFKVARDASIYTGRLKQILLGVADQIAKDLNPPERRPPTPGAMPDDGPPKRFTPDQPPLPEDDPL
ncbi:MAG: hypothetical protein AB1730_09730 [Myxococcota bacterium]